MQPQADEDELLLSDAALAALKEFAFENKLGLQEGGADVRLQVQECMDVKDKDHDFEYKFGGDDDGGGGGVDDELVSVSISLRGIHPELGQTLASTGITVWRGAEELARFMWEHRAWFVGKTLVELGAGLGLCGCLASHLCRGGKVVITDGGEEFTDSAMARLRENLQRNRCRLHGEASLWPAETKSARDNRAQVELERLTWGEHEDFLARHGGSGDDGGRRGGFDFIVAADVIYYEEAVAPLLHTVVDILKLRNGTSDGSKLAEDRREGHGEKYGDTSGTCRKNSGAEEAVSSACGVGEATFVLSFARRNVSIDRVLGEAERLGLIWWIPSDFVPSCQSENIYLMRLGPR